MKKLRKKLKTQKMLNLKFLGGSDFAELTVARENGDSAGQKSTLLRSEQTRNKATDGSRLYNKLHKIIKYEG